MRTANQHGLRFFWQQLAHKPIAHELLTSNRYKRNIKREYPSYHVVASAVLDSEGGRKQRVIFLGTPEVAATVLQKLLKAAHQPGSLFEVSAVVSQPGKPKGRGNKRVPVPSPVEVEARNSGLVPGENILCPASAKDPAFLDTIQQLQPDLCITAAYGNILPQAFLDVPALGTLNIHPSLLPRYRGAAPVQRALCDGVAETGVSVAYTVLKCDAGPVLVQQKVPVDSDIQAPELLQDLFARGASLLLDAMPRVFAGQGLELACPQDEQQTTHAAKLTREEARLDFVRPARDLHNTVRGFAGWPGTSASLALRDVDSGAWEQMEVKVVRTRALGTDVGLYRGLQSEGGPLVLAQEQRDSLPRLPVLWAPDSGDMLVPCQGGETVLRVCVVQPPTKKASAARDFKNGLRGKEVWIA